jgi:hypothetical protein
MNVQLGGYMQKGKLTCESKFWRLQHLFHLFSLLLLRAQTHNQMMRRMGTARTVVTTAAATDLEGITNEESAEAIMGLVGGGGRAAVMDLVGVASTEPATRMMTTARAVAASVECAGSSG